MRADVADIQELLGFINLIHHTITYHLHSKHTHTHRIKYKILSTA